MSSAFIRALVAMGLVAATFPRLACAQREHDLPAVRVTGNGAETIVLLSGLVGGVAGFRRLEAQLPDPNRRIVSIDPYLLSIDSSDVTFAALARRVDRVLDALGVTSARVVGHAHGAGVALRLATNAPQRVTALYFLDVGALPDHRSPIFSSSLRLVPMIAHLPGGRGWLSRRMIKGLRESAGREDWLDAETQRAYTEPMLDGIGRAVALAIRLGRADEPDSLSDLIRRLTIPVTVVLGDAPHTAGPEAPELTALEPLGGLLRIEHMAGVGHFPHEEAPAALASLLLAPRSQIIARQAGGAR
jgi:pimeloyl-ACP methyl ester carboxylesterase